MYFDKEVKLGVFKDVSSLLQKCVSYPAVQQQLNHLIRVSFPSAFRTADDQFLDHMRTLPSDRRANIASVMAYDSRNKQVAGFVQLQYFPKKGVCLIANLCRIRRNKYKGLGRELLDAGVSLSEDAHPDIKRMILHVSSHNPKLKQHYESLGWKLSRFLSAAVHAYEWSIDDDLIFEFE